MGSQPSSSGGGRPPAHTRAVAFEDLAQSFADGGQGPEPRSAGAWRSWERQRAGLSLEPPPHPCRKPLPPPLQGTQPCSHLYPRPPGQIRAGFPATTPAGENVSVVVGHEV